MTYNKGDYKAAENILKSGFKIEMLKDEFDPGWKKRKQEKDEKYKEIM